MNENIKDARQILINRARIEERNAFKKDLVCRSELSDKLVDLENSTDYEQAYFLFKEFREILKK